MMRLRNKAPRRPPTMWKNMIHPLRCRKQFRKMGRHVPRPAGADIPVLTETVFRSAIRRVRRARHAIPKRTTVCRTGRPRDRRNNDHWFPPLFCEKRPRAKKADHAGVPPNVPPVISVCTARAPKTGKPFQPATCFSTCHSGFMRWEHFTVRSPR